MIDSIMPYVTLLVVAAPLIALSGSAVAYVIKVYQEASIRRRGQFFELMRYIDGNAPIATKIAAVYALRDFPEHKSFIVRFCASQKNNITGASAHLLAEEMDKTASYFEGRKTASVEN